VRSGGIQHPGRARAKGRMAALVLLLLGTTLRAQDVAGPDAPARPRPGEIEAWVAQLGDDDSAVRRSAQDRLAKAGRDAVPALRQALSSPDPEARSRAKALLDLLESEFDPVRTQASAGLFRFSPDGSLLCLYPEAGRLELQDARTGKAAWSAPTRAKSLPSPIPAFSADGKRVYAVLESYRFGVFDASQGNVLEEFSMKTLDGAVSGRAMSMTPLAGGTILYSGPEDRSGVYVLEKGTFKVLAHPVVATPSGTAILGLGHGDPKRAAELQWIDSKSWKVKTIGSIEATEAFRAFVAPRGLSRLFLATAREVLAHDPATGALLQRRTVGADDAQISCLAVSPDGGWLAVGLSDGTLQILRAQGLEAAQSITLVEKPLRPNRDNGIADRRAGIPIHAELTENAALVAVQVGSTELKLYRRR